MSSDDHFAAVTSARTDFIQRRESQSTRLVETDVRLDQQCTLLKQPKHRKEFFQISASNYKEI